MFSLAVHDCYFRTQNNYQSIVVHAKKNYDILIIIIMIFVLHLHSHMRVMYHDRQSFVIAVFDAYERTFICLLLIKRFSIYKIVCAVSVKMYG